MLPTPPPPLHPTSVPWEEQVGIAVTVLVQKKKQWMLDWIQEVITPPRWFLLRLVEFSPRPYFFMQILKYVAETRLVQPSPGSDYGKETIHCPTTQSICFFFISSPLVQILSASYPDWGAWVGNLPWQSIWTPSQTSSITLWSEWVFTDFMITYYLRFPFF